MLSLRCGRDGELSPRRSTQAGEFVQPGLRHLRLRQRQLAARHLEVLHEVAPNEVVAVAESGAGLSIRSEKESRVLDRVTGEDKPFCPHVKFLAIEPTDSHRLYGGESFVGFNFDDVGVGVEVDIARVDNFVPVLRAEPRRRAELPHLGPEHIRVLEQRHAIGVAHLPIADIVLVRSELENLLRAGVKRIEVFAANGPPAMRHPIALLEIDRIVRRTEAGPVIGGAAEVMKRRRLQRKVRLPYYLAAIQILHLLLELEAAALEQQNFDRSVV